MKLEDFVYSALLDISKGVERAQTDAPIWIAPGRLMGKLQLDPQMVSFDIAVTSGVNGGASLQVLSFAKGELGGKSESVHRVTFSVPVHFNAPTDHSLRAPDVFIENSEE